MANTAGAQLKESRSGNHSFKNEKLAMIAQMLDEKISGLATMAAR